MEDGKEKEVLTGGEAQSKMQTTRAWGASSKNQVLIPKSSDGNGQVVEVLSSSADQLLTTVYITPPYQLNTNCLLATGATMRLGAFTKDNKFLCYELGHQS
jgi:hypothetical protein